MALKTQHILISCGSTMLDIKSRRCIKHSVNTRDNFVVAFREHNTLAYCNFRTKTAHTCISTTEYTHAQPLSYQLFCVLLLFFTSCRHMVKMCEAAVTERKCEIKDFLERGDNGRLIIVTLCCYNCSDNMSLFEVIIS